MAISDNLERIIKAKNDMRSSISKKGVTFANTELIDKFPSFIDKIKTGGTIASNESIKNSGFGLTDTLPVTPDRQNEMGSDIDKASTIFGDWKKRGTRWSWGNVDKSGIVVAPKIDFKVISNSDNLGPIYDNFPDLETIPSLGCPRIKRFPTKKEVVDYNIKEDRQNYLIYNCPKLTNIPSFYLYPDMIENPIKKVNINKLIIDKNHYLDSDFGEYYLYYNDTGIKSKLERIGHISFNQITTWGTNVTNPVIDKEVSDNNLSYVKNYTSKGTIEGSNKYGLKNLKSSADYEFINILNETTFLECDTVKYESAYQALCDILSKEKGCNPFEDFNTPTDITNFDIYGTFKTYYDEKIALLNSAVGKINGCNLHIGFDNGSNFDFLTKIGGISGFIGNIFLENCPNLTKESWINISNTLDEIRNLSICTDRMVNGMASEPNISERTGGHIYICQKGMDLLTTNIDIKKLIESKGWKLVIK